jgi:hypothetical protein
MMKLTNSAFPPMIVQSQEDEAILLNVHAGHLAERNV